MNKTDIYILGAGGHTRSLLNLLDKYTVKGILDESYQKDSYEEVCGIPLIAHTADAILYKNIVISSGNPAIREKWATVKGMQLLPDNLIHAKAYIEKYVTMASSNQIMAMAYINSYVIVGSNNLINTGAIIEHEVTIGNNNHISIGVCIGGRSSIGNNCFIGASAVVIDKVSVADNVIIGANSLVLKDISEAGTYVGSPVRKIK